MKPQPQVNQLSVLVVSGLSNWTVTEFNHRGPSSLNLITLADYDVFCSSGEVWSQKTGVYLFVKPVKVFFIF